MLRRPALAVSLAALALAGCGGSSSSSSPASTVVARGPVHLAALAYDSRGRLWATAAGLGAHAGDGVYLLRPGKSPLLVVRGLKDPLGLLWLHGRLYVSSIGRVDSFAGFDGTRFATRKRILDGPVAGGENNELAPAPDGRIVMGVTASCDHCVPRSKWSGAIVSFRPDGSGLRLYAARIRAPVGLAFAGGRLYATMDQRDDLGNRTPGDWLSVVAAGSDWRSPACYGQGGSACAGVPRPLATLDAHAAVGGLAIVNGAAIVAEWQSGKVLRVTLGGKVTPYLTGIAHPLAVLSAPDGSVLVGDWASGKVYRAKAGSR